MNGYSLDGRMFFESPDSFSIISQEQSLEVLRGVILSSK